MGVDQARAIASGSAEVSIREIDRRARDCCRNQLEKLFILRRRAPNKHIHGDLPGIIVNMNKRTVARRVLFMVIISNN